MDELWKDLKGRDVGAVASRGQAMAKLGYSMARSYKRPVSTLQNGSALWGAIQHSEKFLLIKNEYLKNWKQLWKHSPELSGEEWRAGSWAKAIGNEDGENNVGDSTPLQNCQIIPKHSAGKTGPERPQITCRVLSPFCSRNQEISAVILLRSEIRKGHLLPSQPTQLLVRRCSFLTRDNQQRETGPCLIFCLTWLVPTGVLLWPPTPGSSLYHDWLHGLRVAWAVVFPLQEKTGCHHTTARTTESTKHAFNYTD